MDLLLDDEPLAIHLLDQPKPVLVPDQDPDKALAHAPVAPAPQPPRPATRSASARVLEYAPGHHIALPVHAALELIDQPSAVAVPGSAYYGVGMTRWRDEWLPVIELPVLLYAYRQPYAAPARYHLVVAYQVAPGQPLQHGVLALPELPFTIEVNDSEQCDLPDDCDLWPLISLACFRYQGRPVPVVDAARLFERYHD
jgi:hypothetical protein